MGEVPRLAWMEQATPRAMIKRLPTRNSQRRTSSAVLFFVPTAHTSRPAERQKASRAARRAATSSGDRARAASSPLSVRET